MVASREGKTRGAITNLFGSQASFQAATMALALYSRDWIEQIHTRLRMTTRMSVPG